MTLPTETLEQIQRLAEAATSGEWWRKHAVMSGDTAILVGEKSIIGEFFKQADHSEFHPSDSNAAFIVALVNAWPALRDEVTRLRGALEQIANPQPTFAGPQCCQSTFDDACELFSGIAREAMESSE